MLYSIVILPHVFIRIGHILEWLNELFVFVQQTLEYINKHSFLEDSYPTFIFIKCDSFDVSKIAA